MLQHRGEFDRQLRFHRQPPLNGAVAILRPAQQRDPVVVEIADIFVGQVVHGRAQIGSRSRDAAAARARPASCPRSCRALRVGVPEPRLPQAADRLHAGPRERDHWRGRQARRPVPCAAPARRNDGRRRAWRPSACARWERQRRQQFAIAALRVRAIHLPQAPGGGALHQLARIVQQPDQQRHGRRQRQSSRALRLRPGGSASRWIAPLLPTARKTAIGRAVPERIEFGQAGAPASVGERLRRRRIPSPCAPGDRESTMRAPARRTASRGRAS